MQQIKIGCEVFIIKKGKVLLGKRKNCFGEGTWGLPGGHLEYKEKLVDAAKRELEEELGIKNAELEMVTIVDDLAQEKFHYIHVSFVLKNYEGEIKLMEPDQCEEWKYFDIEKLPEDIFPPHKRIFETFMSEKLYLY